MVKLQINGKDIQVTENTTILDAAKENGIYIPHFCYLKGLHKSGSCRMCIVEIEGARTLQASCMTTVKEGMVVHTNSAKVRKARKVVYELLLSDHNKECLVCSRNGHCDLQEVAERLQINESRFEGEKSKSNFDDTNPSIVRDMSKCILCKRCESMCNNVQGVGAISSQKRGFKSVIAPSEGFRLGEMDCTYCGQCTLVCPVGALQEKDSTEVVWDALADDDKYVIVQTAPAVRAALGEALGYEAGTCVTGQMVSALRSLGFDNVFDTNFAADLTIIEEGHEFLQRVSKLLNQEEVTLPMITSCSPGWIKYIEHRFPKQLNHLSTCKSPHMMMGAILKSYYAEKIGVPKEKMFVVSVMPCTAKKFEISREEMIEDVDAVITTRELAKMIKSAGIDFENIEPSEFDQPLGLSSGAADIFANTGGVMEAALRTVYEVVSGEQFPFENLHVKPIMGLESIKEGSVVFDHVTDEFKDLKGKEVKFAVASGLTSADKLLKEIECGESPYMFIEIMCCPGGCINGGGQPRSKDDQIREKRLKAIYKEDEGKEIRKSHENPMIKKLYEEYLIEPLGEKSHHLLHTKYVERERINKTKI